MASRYYGINRGATEDGVTDNSSTTSKDLEVVFDLTKNFTQEEILRALEYISNYILKNQFPPA